MSTNLPPEIDPSPYGPVTASMVTHLHAMRPWILFLAILGFLSTALVMGGAVLMAIFGAALFSADGSMSESAAMGMGIGLGLVYVLVGLLYGFWSYLLLSIANAVSAMKNATSVEALTTAMELALDRQRRFWKVTGIAVIVTVVVYIGAIIAIAAIAAVAAAAVGAGAVS